MRKCIPNAWPSIWLHLCVWLCNLQSNLLVLSPCDDVEYAMGLMTENNIRHLPVVHSHHLLGVLSIRDVVRFITNLTSHTDFKEWWQARLACWIQPCHWVFSWVIIAIRMEYSNVYTRTITEKNLRAFAWLTFWCVYRSVTVHWTF